MQSHETVYLLIYTDFNNSICKVCICDNVCIQIGSNVHTGCLIWISYYTNMLSNITGFPVIKFQVTKILMKSLLLAWFNLVALKIET